MPDCTSAPGDLSGDVKTGQKLDATRQVDLTSVQCMQSAESTAVSSNGCCTCEFLVVSIGLCSFQLAARATGCFVGCRVAG